MADSDAEAGSPLIPCATQLPLTLEAVRSYAADLFWRRIRATILLTLFVLWVAMLAAATAVVITAPPCHSTRARRAAVDGLVYRVEAGSSFYDGASSGRGDLRGLITKLDYLVELGVDIVWLSSIYKSPNKNFVYEVEDFQEVDQEFGTMEIFKELVSEIKRRGLKLVIDLVPNHTSNKHVWFQKSINQIEPYTDYYVWVAPSKFDGEGNPIPPNNWMSKTGGSAWEFNEERKKYYLHQFSNEQPDLNFHNEKVLEEMLDIFRFWLDLGVDGFSLDAIPQLFEDLQLRDEPLIDNKDQLTGIITSYDSLNHIYTYGLPENLEMLLTFRDYMEEYSNMSDGMPRFIMTGFYNTVKENSRYYDNASKPLLGLLFNSILTMNLNSSSSAHDVMNAVSMWLDNIPQGMNANWVIGNYGQRRVADKLGPNMVDGMNMIALLLPGIAITYYGEEMGMGDTLIMGNNTFISPSSISGENIHPEKSTQKISPPTPMLWNMSWNAGFSSSNTTQLPVNKNYPFKNIKAQDDGDGHLNVYKQLSKAREEPAIKFGHLEMKVLNDSVFAFTRHEPEYPLYLVAVNWSEDHVQVDFGLFDSVSKKATVYVQSTGTSRRNPDIKDIHAVLMEPKEGLVLIFEPPNS